jgi:nitrogen fixation/metabolism regulation signal transduction histidine kinase
MDAMARQFLNFSQDFKWWERLRYQWSIRFKVVPFSLVLVIILTLACLGLLAWSTRDFAMFGERYAAWFGVGMVSMSTIVVAVVVRQAWRLRRAAKEKKFGARLTQRLILIFGLVALIPGLVLYLMSMQFLARNVEPWFVSEIDRALESAVNLGHSTFEYLLRDAVMETEQLAQTLSLPSTRSDASRLAILREQSRVHELALFLQGGKLQGFASANIKAWPDWPSPEAWRAFHHYQVYKAFETHVRYGLVFKVSVPVIRDGKVMLLQSIHPVPETLRQHAERVQSGRDRYKQLDLVRPMVQRLYTVGLTLTLVLAVFVALAVGFVLSELISTPLARLAEGTRALAAGDFSHRPPVVSDDELGTLTASFNTMTTQLSEAKQQALERQQALEDARAYLEGVLRHLSAGVLAFDEQGFLRSANAGASIILQQDFETLIGVGPSFWPESLLSLIAPLKSWMTSSPEATWQEQIMLDIQGISRILLVRGSPLKTISLNGFVVVFDDISALLQAQREAAWGEVARRLAHEIKNPLTPIQLSAERLEFKLRDQLDEASRALLGRSTQTIVHQVQALKSMVDEFAVYAKRINPKNWCPVDCHALWQEVLTLYEAHPVRIEVELNAPHYWVMGEATRLRQVWHNLLQNGVDAIQECAEPRLRLSSINLGTMWDMTLEDNGPGWSAERMERLFEPYMTTKAKGTGLGLAIVKKIVEEHGGTVQLLSATHEGYQGGACVRVQLPVKVVEDALNTVEASVEVVSEGRA